MYAVKATRTLRVSEDGELEGIDIHEHGGPAYHMEFGMGTSYITAHGAAELRRPGAAEGVRVLDLTSPTFQRLRAAGSSSAAALGARRSVDRDQAWIRTGAAAACRCGPRRSCTASTWWIWMLPSSKPSADAAM